MRKTITVIAAIAMVFTMFAGCASVKPQASQPSGTVSEEPASTPAAVSEDPAVSAEPETSPAAETSAAAGVPTNPTDSYTAYINVKSGAYERISKKIEGNDELALSVGMSLFTVGAVDLALVPLTVVSAGEGGEAALEMLGLTDVKVAQNGNDYTVSYTDPQNGAVSLACKYDPATDSLQSTVSDSTGKETVFFEYVKIGSGYASQYYIDNGDGTFTELTSFINDTDTAAFGIKSADVKPASIMGNTSLNEDFVKTAETYFILKGDALTLFENGAEKTY
jgi:hypothetical protein